MNVWEIEKWVSFLFYGQEILGNSVLLIRVVSIQSAQIRTYV